MNKNPSRGCINVMLVSSIFWLVICAVIFALMTTSCAIPVALPGNGTLYIAPEVGSAPVPVKEYIVTAGKLNVRQSPNGIVLKYYYLKAGQEVIVYERTDGWCRISKDGISERWIFCKWVQ